MLKLKAFVVKFLPLILLAIIIISFVVINKYAGNGYIDNGKEDKEEKVVVATADEFKTSYSDKELAELNKVIEHYIDKNPQVIIASVDKMMKNKAGEQKDPQKISESVKQNLPQIRSTATTPFVGSTNSNMIMVEFFDYACSYCKHAEPIVEELLKTMPNVKVIYRELPILGEASTLMSRAALAVYLMDATKYQGFHKSLMNTTEHLTDEAAIISFAKKLGVNGEKLKIMMRDPRVSKMLDDNYKLATAISVNGTPGFIIGEQLLPGVIDLNTMKEKLKASQ